MEENPQKDFFGTKEDRRTWDPRQGSPRGPTSPHPAARGEVAPSRLVGPLAALFPRSFAYIFP